MSFGTLVQHIDAARYKISREAVAVNLASDVKVRFTRTRDRINTRGGAIDSFRWALEEVEFTAALTDLLLTAIEADVVIDASGRPGGAAIVWNVAGVAFDGTSDTAQALTCFMLDYENLGPENGVTLARIKLVAVSGAV